MITREQALRHLAELPPLGDLELVPLVDCAGRVLAEDVHATLTRPPAAMSAMDGYAVRREDAEAGAALQVIGESPAGAPFSGNVGARQCVRVFTGSVIPDGLDHVVIQEDVSREGETIFIQTPLDNSRNIRAAGIDFFEGDVLVHAGTRIGPAHLSLCAAANHAHLPVRRRPKVGLLTNGDELRPPGSALLPGQIISSNEYALQVLIRDWGADPVNLGTARDDPEDIRKRIEGAFDLDVLVPIGGASVGDHDHMKSVFAELGFEPVFSKVAVQPGKPTWHSRRGAQSVLGLPGNPASALVCAHLFLRPLLQGLLGQNTTRQWVSGRLTAAIPANGQREAFLRGNLDTEVDGTANITPAPNQDSSLLRPFVTANVMIHRPPGAPALEPGGRVEGILLS
ncbi:MAG: molybdopterin molybdotransferase MoeA [Hyphomonas sp.]|nr:molybdopterin molybdotransferase MoeA [Hyphomonas sp.]